VKAAGIPSAMFGGRLARKFASEGAVPLFAGGQANRDQGVPKRFIPNPWRTERGRLVRALPKSEFWVDEASTLQTPVDAVVVHLAKDSGLI
jgi:hypothetical protein